MARTWDNSASTTVDTAIGGNATSYGTLAALIYIPTLGSQRHTVIVCMDGSSNSEHALIIQGTAGTVSGAYNGVQTSGGPNITAAAWWLIAATKATGATTPRMHAKNISTNGAWSHTNVSSGTEDNGSTATQIKFGSDHGGGEPLNGDLAIAGAWAGTALSDALVEALDALTVSRWLSLTPTGLWLFDQSLTTQAVADLTGGGANQTATSGTAVSTRSVPLLNYGAGPWLIVRPQGGAGGITGTGAITIGAPALAGTGTFSTTGTGAPSIAKPVLAGTGTAFDGPVSGTGAVSIGAPSLAGSGTFSTTGSGAVSIAAPALSGAGTFATVGTAAMTIGAPTLAGTGAFATVGSGAITISAPVVDGDGTFDEPGSFTGSVAVTISTPALSGAGTFEAGAIAGTAAVSIGAPAISGAGTFAVTGAAAVTVSGPALSGSGTFVIGTISGSGVVTILAPSLLGVGAFTTTGMGAITIGPPSLLGYSVLATRAAASDAAYGSASASDAAYTVAGAGDTGLVGATASDSEV